MEDQNKDIMQEGQIREEVPQTDRQMPEEPLQVEAQMQTEGLIQEEGQIQAEVSHEEGQIQIEVLQAEGQIQTEVPQVEQTWMDGSIYTMPDVYQTQSDTEIYQTQTVQDIYQSSDMSEDNHGMGGLFSGKQSESSMNNSVYGDNKSATDGYVNDPNNNNYGNNGMGVNQYQYGNNDMNGNQYQYGNNGITGNQYQYVNNEAVDNQYQYGNDGVTGNQYQYGNNGAVDNQYQYGNDGVTGNQYQYGNNGVTGNQYQYGNNGATGTQYQNGNNGATGNQYQYGNNGATGTQYQYGNNGATGNQYQYGNNGASGNQYQYGNNGAAGNRYQYGNPYVYNQNGYSPFAAPQKKKQTGLIIGIIIAIVVVFLIALLAIIYNAFKNIYNTTGRVEVNSVQELTDDDTDRDNGDNRNSSNRNSRDYGRDDDNDYDEDDYYEFHDDVKNNLSYSIRWDYFEYDTDNENVSIYIDYPVIVGDDVPNLDKLNAAIESEVSLFSEYYEDEYAQYMDDNDDSYFFVSATGYVTYMSESVLSVAFQEEIASNFFSAVYIYCINIDMNAGVVMDNTDIIEVDDDFSVDFRERNEKQNGKISALDSMSDQEITKHLKSSDNLIIFYTPQGMEIGINYGDGSGWVTVTYHDYKKYLKVF